MKELDDEKKSMILSVAVETIAYEYRAANSRHATESHEIPEFYAKLDPNCITGLILAKNSGSAKLIADSLAMYPRFLSDLHDAIEQGKIGRTQRAERTVT